MKYLQKWWVYVCIIGIVFLFSYPVFTQRLLPIPSDTIIGLYHPFRDLYAKEYPNGIPYKNFLITDPVRQQYPWKNLVIENITKGQLPLWNPYAFAGTPLLANIQSAVFYPGNLLFFILPFAYAWTVLILLQPILAASFMFLYLRNLKLHIAAALLGSISFAFSGFFVAWFTWGTVLHVALWLPLILFCIDKLAVDLKGKKQLLIYASILVLSLCFSFFAGHIQTFFYLIMLTGMYILIRAYQKKKKDFLIPIGVIGVLFVCFTFVQWYPTLQLILSSGRDIDQADWNRPGWFIPIQHSIQFIVPDFFGNPATLNYWSEWNYAEFVGYIGIAPLVMALYALFFRRDKKTLFGGLLLLIAILFAYATPIAKIPYLLSLPFISTTQPTRLLFLIDFILAVLAALGLDYFIKQKKNLIYPLGMIGIFLVGIWALIFFGQGSSFVTSENMVVAKRNLYLPTILFFLIGATGITAWYFQKKKYMVILVSILFIGITIFDLFRFMTKFTPFTPTAYLYPSTKAISFLQKDTDQFRIMTTDSQILPPNFSSMYHLESVDGYDPIYLKNYAELIAASERGKGDITPPFGFNRIITPHNYNSRIMDLLGVKYILSLSDITSPKVTKVFQEGKTRIYKNSNVYPRVFFVSQVLKTQTTEQVFQALFDPRINLEKTAITNDILFTRATSNFSLGNATIIKRTDNEITVETSNTGEGFLVVTNNFHPVWKAKIASLDDQDQQNIAILRTDHTLQGIIVPRGKHRITFYTALF